MLKLSNMGSALVAKPVLTATALVSVAALALSFYTSRRESITAEARGVDSASADAVATDTILASQPPGVLIGPVVVVHGRSPSVRRAAANPCAPGSQC